MAQVEVLLDNLPAACRCAYSTNAFSVEISRMSSTSRARVLSSSSVHTRYARHRARLIATLRRLRENRKSAPRGTSSPAGGRHAEEHHRFFLALEFVDGRDVKSAGIGIAVEEFLDEQALIVVGGDDDEILHGERLGFVRCSRSSRCRGGCGPRRR